MEDEQKDDSFDDFEAPETIETSDQAKPEGLDPIQPDDKEGPADDKILETDEEIKSMDPEPQLKDESAVTPEKEDTPGSPEILPQVTSDDDAPINQAKEQVDEALKDVKPDEELKDDDQEKTPEWEVKEESKNEDKPAQEEVTTPLDTDLAVKKMESSPIPKSQMLEEKEDIAGQKPQNEATPEKQDKVPSDSSDDAPIEGLEENKQTSDKDDSFEDFEEGDTKEVDKKDEPVVEPEK